MPGKDEQDTLTWGEENRPREDQTFTQAPQAVDSETTLSGLPNRSPNEKTNKVTWEPGDVIEGRYEVKGLIGQGGMGTVYRVQHREWNIEMAVKMLHPERVADEASKARFVREAETWVDLGLHPNIVQCYYVREMGGVPRVFMDYLPEGSLKDWMRKGKIAPDGWDRMLDLAIQACDGLGYAHERGVVHRDVKPANMLMAEDGRLCVTDFGLVKLAGLEEIPGDEAVRGLRATAHTLTTTGAGMGTPEYGAPEQWGGADTADARVDIYALGGILYELCCGRRPFDDGRHREPPHVLIGRHLSEPAPDPREFNRRVPHLLTELILRCLEKRPEDRPLSMAALRERLSEVYEEITGKRYERPAPTAAALRADALNNKAVSLWDLGKQEEAHSLWEETLEIDAAHPEALYNHLLMKWRAGEVTAHHLVQRLGEAKNTNSRAGLYLGYAHLELVHVQEAEKELFQALKLAGAGRNSKAWLSWGDASMAQEDFEKAERIYSKALEASPEDADSLSRLAMAKRRTREHGKRIVFPNWQVRFTCEGHVDAVHAVALTKDGRLALSGGEDGYVRVWELAGGTCLRVMEGPPEEIWALSVTPDGKFAVSGGSGCSLGLWDLSSGEFAGAIERYESVVKALAMTPDGKFFASGAWDKTVRIWDLAAGECVRVLEGHSDPVRALDVTSDGRGLVSGSWDKTIRLWDMASGECRQVCKGHTKPVLSLSLTPDGCFAVSGSEDGTIRLWELSTGRCMRVLEGHSKSVSSVVVTPDGFRALSAGWDDTVRLWKLDTGECLRVFKGHTEEIWAVGVTADGQFGISGGNDGTLHVWEIAPPDTYRGALSVNRGMGYEQNHALMQLFKKRMQRALSEKEAGDYLSCYMHIRSARAVAGYERDPDALSLNAELSSHLPRKQLHAVWFQKAFRGHQKDVRDVAIAPDNRFVLSASDDETCRLWDLRSGECLRVFRGHANRVNALDTFGDGARFISGGSDGTLRIWNLATGKCERTLPGHGDRISSVKITPNRQFIVSGSADKTVRVWDVETGECVRVLEGHREGVFALRLTKDGRYVLSVGHGAGQVVLLWDVEAGESVEVFQGTSALAVTPDGRYALSPDAASWKTQNDFHLWDLTTGEKRRSFVGHSERVLALEVTLDARFALSGASDHSLRIWDVSTGQVVSKLETRDERLNALALSTDGRFLLSGGDSGLVSLWELDWELDQDHTLESVANAEEVARGKVTAQAYGFSFPGL